MDRILGFIYSFNIYIQGVRAGWPVRAASHVHLVVAELCCGTPCQLPAERWELAGKTQRQSSIKSSAIVNSCQSLKKVISFIYHKGLDNTLFPFYFLVWYGMAMVEVCDGGTSYFVIYNIECKVYIYIYIYIYIYTRVYTQLPKFLMFNCQRAGQVGPAPHPERCHNRNEKNN